MLRRVIICWRRHDPAARATDEGITFVEVVVTVALIVAVMVPFTVLFYNTLGSAATNGARQDGATLATSVISKLQAGYYSDVGFTSSTLSSYLSSSTYGESVQSGSYYWNSQQLVAVTTQPTFKIGSQGVTFAPVLSITTEGTRFTVVTHVAYASGETAACPGSGAATTALAQAYKRVYVTVTWNEGGQFGQSLTQDSVIYPGGQPPYQGPTYNAAEVPSTPTGIQGTGMSQAGEVKVQWDLPSEWEADPPTSCFAIFWSDTAQSIGSTGLLSNSLLTVSSGVASYAVTSLVPGSSYVFYVTAYSPDGVESAESNDSGIVTAPLGPIVKAISPPAGTSGTNVTLTGSAFSTPSMNVQFCPATGSCPSSSATWLSVSCSSTTTCTVVAPTPPSGVATGIFTIVAETPTGPGGSEVTSPPLAPDQFTYTPIVSGVTPSSGSAGTTVAVSGTNLYPGTAFAFGTTEVLSGATCNSSGTSCTMLAPSGSGTVDVIATDNNVSSATSSADKFTFS